ncbi:hypothetical protein SESBI_27072 [Sesbania bispinosa]|nr:hypothetical protein SESBI_27072 [Sesbania bispinosa]
MKECNLIKTRNSKQQDDRISKWGKGEMHLTLCDRVIDIDSGEQEGTLACICWSLLTPVVVVLERPSLSCNGKHNLKIGVVRGSGTRELPCLLICLLNLHSWVSNVVSSSSPTMRLGPLKGNPIERTLGAPLILLEGLSFPSEGGNIVAIDGSNDVVLR